MRSCGRGVRRFDFGEGGGAALADGWVAGVFADVGGVVPAAVAFFAVGFLNGDGKRWNGVGFEVADAGSEEIHLRDDQEAGQVGELGFEFCFELEVSAEKDLGFEAGIDFLFVARSFESFQDLGADFGKKFPCVDERWSDSCAQFGFFRK